MATGDWDPAQYGKFAVQRAQPFWDLADLIRADSIETWIDLGCGNGELTAALADRLPGASAVGLDNSPAMLASAAERDTPTLRFAHGDLSELTAGHVYDLVLANASLQWVGDHAAVIQRWTAALRPGGQLAVQVPANSDHPSHQASVHVAMSEPFVSAMNGAPPPDPVAVNVLAPEQYAELLFALGFGQQHVRLQVYPHVLSSSTDVVDWTKGTSLTRFFKVLPVELHEHFVDAYRSELLARIGDVSPYFYAFKRILMWGRLPG